MTFESFTLWSWINNPLAILFQPGLILIGLCHFQRCVFPCHSETVKFGHVTFFWNGNRSGYFNPEMEEYVEIPSDSGIDFNVKSKMKVLEIAGKARDAILSGEFHQVLHKISCFVPS